MGGKVSLPASLLDEVADFSESLKASLLEGVNIVVDRYVYSGVAFSAAKVCHSVTQLRHYVNIWHRDLIILGVEIQM